VPLDRETLHRLGILLVTIDRPGVGLSDPQPGRRLLDWPANVVAVADQLGLERFAVLGRSAGAAYAVACAYQLPDRVRSATLVSGVGPPTAEAEKLLAASGLCNLLRCLRAAPPIARPTLWLAVRAARPHVRAIFSRHVAKLPEADRVVLADPATYAMRLATLQESLAQAEVGIYHDALALTRPWGFEPGQVAIPVRIWHGDADTIVNVGFALQLSLAIPHSKMVLEAGAGHYLMFTHWQQILETVLEDSDSVTVPGQRDGRPSPAAATPSKPTIRDQRTGAWWCGRMHGQPGGRAGREPSSSGSPS